MSFNPVGNWVPPQVHKEPVIQVSKGKRICKAQRKSHAAVADGLL